MPRVRRWRVLLGLAAGVLVVGGALAWRAVQARLRGPPLPVCARRLAPPSLFSAPRQLSSPQSPGARLYDIEPAVALLPDGALALAWNARDSFLAGTSGLVTARLDPTGALEVHPLAAPRTEAFDAWLTTAVDGVAHLVWLAHDGGRPERHMQVAHATSADARTWVMQPPAHLASDCPEDGRGCLDKPMVAPGASGVVTFYFSGDGLKVVAPGATQSTRLASGAYASVERSSSGGLHLAVVVDRESPDAGAGGGEAEEAGTEAWGSLGMRVVYLHSADDGHSWSAPAFASADDEPIPFFFSNPQVAVDDARGVVAVAYPTGLADGAWVLRLAVSRDGGAHWNRVTVNDDGVCATHMAPQLALDPTTGALHLTWLDNRSGVGALVTARCEPSEGRCGPNQTVSAPFAAFSFERHLPAWLSEYGALLVDDQRRTLHAVWTQPVLEDGRATSRIFHASAPLPER